MKNARGFIIVLTKHRIDYTIISRKGSDIFERRNQKAKVGAGD
nr:MAG TPA: hypothetical protein [Caudoviricetes sp.]